MCIASVYTYVHSNIACTIHSNTYAHIHTYIHILTHMYALYYTYLYLYSVEYRGDNGRCSTGRLVIYCHRISDLGQRVGVCVYEYRGMQGVGVGKYMRAHIENIVRVYVKTNNTITYILNSALVHIQHILCTLHYLIYGCSSADN